MGNGLYADYELDECSALKRIDDPGFHSVLTLILRKQDAINKKRLPSSILYFLQNASPRPIRDTISWLHHKYNASATHGRCLDDIAEALVEQWTQLTAAILDSDSYVACLPERRPFVSYVTEQSFARGIAGLPEPCLEHKVHTKVPDTPNHPKQLIRSIFEKY